MQTLAHFRRLKITMAYLMGAAIIPACMIPPAGAAANDSNSEALAAHTQKDRLRLWEIVHDQCLPAADRNSSSPSPCALVTRMNHGSYAVLKDRAGAYQYLLIPLDRVTGIESAAIATINAPNYFEDAWLARHYVEQAFHSTLPRDAVSLAINAPASRSQDQLHIHIDCIRPDVREVLKRNLSGITAQWQRLPEPLPPYQHIYTARWISGRNLLKNPFHLLKKSLAKTDEMAMHGLILVGANSPNGKPGFLALTEKVNPADHNFGSTEELQDQSCAAALAK